MSISLISLLVIVGFLIGLSKTSIGGIGMINAALLATVLPAKETPTSYEDCDNIVDEIWPRKWIRK
jgi:hypothetical protein